MRIPSTACGIVQNPLAEPVSKQHEGCVCRSFGTNMHAHFKGDGVYMQAAKEATIRLQRQSVGPGHMSAHADRDIPVFRTRIPH